MKSALVWKLLERFGVYGIQFVLQVVLARILDPEHYGVLSIMVIFTTLANVFIQNGFNTALVQNKDVTEEDYSSVFWVSLGISGAIYAVLYIAAPLIGSFYDMPDIVAPFRVLALMLFPGALNSVQIAKVSRELDFKKVFVGNVGAIVISGAAGIAIALLGGGLWALVVQTMLNIFVACLVMLFVVKWRPRFVCNLARIKVLFAFGWKLLVSGLIDTLYQDLRSLVVGKKYSAETLGFYNRGKQFPQLIISAVNGAVQSVMLPVMAKEQDDRQKVKALTAETLRLSSYVIFPIMAGLAAVATPLVRILLTDKWLPCVPYLQIYCFTYAFWPVHTANLQAINAIGRSDMFLTMEIIKKIYGLITLVIAVFCFDSPLAIAATGIVTTAISCFINAYPNKKLLGYSYAEQMRDILPSFLLSMAMFGAVYCIGFLGLNDFVTIALQVVAGVVVYLAGSIVFRYTAYTQLRGLLGAMLKKGARK